MIRYYQQPVSNTANNKYINIYINIYISYCLIDIIYINI